LIVVNTCTVTAAAAQKCRQQARALRRKFPDAVIVAAGCGPQAEPVCWNSVTAVDIVVDHQSKLAIPKLVANFAKLGGKPGRSAPPSFPADRIFREDAPALFPRRTRAFLKVQDGCDNACAYCIVPRARGPERSRDCAEVAAECARLVAAGHREIVLTGVNLCAWRQRGRGIADLVAELLAIPGDWRLRLSSLEPHPAVADLVALIAEHPDRICRFLHLPLQHGDDEILARMNRPYRVANFAKLAESAFALLPGLHLGTDLIVGLPGETDANFARSRDLVAALPLANVHLFRFSPRPGTAAAAMPDPVPPRIALRRWRELHEVAATLAEKFRARQVGQTLVVLTEKRRGADVEGWSDNYLRVRIASPTLPLNALVRARIAGVDGNILRGVAEGPK
jgi:threonylcarbamoyladenosine tRNA methylthiotransferase MtaB